MGRSGPETSSATDSTERGPGNVADIGASSAERRCLQPRAHRTTGCSIEELLSTRSSASESRVSVFPRSLGSRGLSGTPSRGGSRGQPKCVVDSTTKGSPGSQSRSSKPTRFAFSHARSKEKLEDYLELVRCHYNFVRPHRALRFGRETRTPAMQAGLTARRLTLREVFVCTCTLLIEKVTIAFRGARTEAADTDVQNALAA